MEVETSYSAVEVVVTETLLDVVLAFVMELTKFENLELELLGRNCDFELLPTSPWPRGSSPASTSASSCPSPPCSCCAPCTWPGWAGRALSCTWAGWAGRALTALLGGFLVQEVRQTWSDGKLGLELYIYPLQRWVGLMECMQLTYPGEHPPEESDSS